jgi:dihydroflavonol-4-reductase
MRVLVTGANGHIGSNLVRALSERRYEVLATVRSLGETSRNAPIASLPNVTLAELDIRDADRFRSLCDNIDILFHVAATYAYHIGSRTSEEAMIADSVEGAASAIRAAARQVRKVVMTSSVVTVPLRRPGETLATEDEWQTDFSVPYFQAKTEAERQAWELAQRYNVPLVTLLPGVVCGPGFTRGTPSTDTIEGIMRGTLRFGAPRMYLGIVDVRDVVLGHILAAERDVGGRFILCGDRVTTLREIATMMHEIDRSVPTAPLTLPDFLAPSLPIFDWLNARLFDSPPVLTPEFAEAVVGRQFFACNKRATTELGWSPQIPIRQTLSDTMDTIRNLRRSAGRKV